MTGNTIESRVQAALKIHDSDGSAGTQLVSIAQHVRQQVSSLNELGLGTAVEILLDEFVRLGQSDMIRRWAGVALLAIAEKEPLHLASTSQFRQHALGDVIFSRTSEDIRLLAGAIIRCVAADGVSLDTFWSPHAETALIDKFPRLGESQWIEQFEESLEVLALDTLSNADMYWAVYATVDRDTFRPRGGRVVLFAEHDCLKLVTPPTPGPPQFLDILFEHIATAQVALLPVTGNGRSSNLPVLEIDLDHKAPLNVMVDAKQKHSNQVKIWFKDVESAKEISNIISQSCANHGAGNNSPPAKLPAPSALLMKVAKSSRPVKCSQDNSSSPAPVTTSNKTSIQTSRPDDGKAQPLKIVSRMQDEHGRSSPLKVPIVRSKSKDKRASAPKGSTTRVVALDTESLHWPDGGVVAPNKKSDRQAKVLPAYDTVSRTLTYDTKTSLRSSNMVGKTPEITNSPTTSTSGTGLSSSKPKPSWASNPKQPLHDQENLPIQIQDKLPSAPAPTPTTKHAPLRTPMTRAKAKRLHVQECALKPSKKAGSLISSGPSTSESNTQPLPLQDITPPKPATTASRMKPIDEKLVCQKASETTIALDLQQIAAIDPHHDEVVTPVLKRCRSPEEDSPSKRAQLNVLGQNVKRSLVVKETLVVSPVTANIPTTLQLSSQVDENGSPPQRYNNVTTGRNIVVTSSQEVVRDDTANRQATEGSSNAHNMLSTSPDAPTDSEERSNKASYVHAVDLDPQHVQINKASSSSSLELVERAPTTATAFCELTDTANPPNIASHPTNSSGLKPGVICTKESRVIPFKERLRSRLPRPKFISAKITKDWDENEDTLVEEQRESSTPLMQEMSPSKPRPQLPQWFQDHTEKSPMIGSDDRLDASAGMSEQGIEDRQQSSTEADEKSCVDRFDGHHLELYNQLCIISGHLIGLVASQEAAVSQIVDRYRENSCQVVEQLVQSHAEEAAAKLSMLSTTKTTLIKSLGDCEHTIVTDHKAYKHLSNQLSACKSRHHRVSKQSFERLLSMCG